MTSLQKRFDCSGGWLTFLLAAASILVAAIMIILVSYGHASTGFPPISFIASELNIRAGQPLPKGVVWNGRPYFFYIISAQERSNGRYVVELKAR